MQIHKYKLGRTESSGGSWDFLMVGMGLELLYDNEKS